MDQTKPFTRFRSVATAIAVGLTLTLAAGAGCDSRREPGPPSVRERLEQSHLKGQPTLRIGSPTTEPLMGALQNGAHVGFDIEIAKFVGASLGYREDRIEFVPVDTEDRIQALQSGQVDLVVASFSMTGEREKLVSFAGPYFVTSQEVMVPNRLKDKIQTIQDLADPAYRVCASGGSTSELELGRHAIKVNVVRSVAECVQGIRANKYDAVSSDQTILAGFLSQYPTEFKIVDMPFGNSEQLGIGVPISDPALRDVVAFVLQQSYLKGRNGGSSPWLTAYNTTLGPWLEADREQPPPLNVPDLVDFDKAPSP